MSSLFETLTGVLGSGSALGAIGGLLGDSDESTTKGALGAAVPALLGGLAKRSTSANGASALFELVKGNDGSILDNIGGFLGQDDGGVGDGLVGAVLGGSRGAVESGLAESTGLNLGSIAGLLPKLLPLVLGFLGKKQSDDGQDKAGFLDMLSGEKTAIESAGMGNILGLLDTGDDDDDDGFVGKLSGLVGMGGAAGVLGGLAGKGGDVLSGLTGSAGDIAGGAKDIVSGAAGTVTGGVGKASAAASGAARKATTSVTSHTVVKEEGKKRGLWPWLLLLGAALLGFLLWSSCGGSSTDTTTTTAAAAPETEAPATEAPATEAPATDAPEVMAATVADAATLDGNFTTLLAAAEAAGISDALTGADEVTVLAPTDAAFAALPDGAVEALLANPDVLRDVLLNHVVAGKADSAAVAGLTEVTTLGGSVLPVVVDGDNITVGGIAVTNPDIDAENGVIHGIDGVILPEGFDLAGLLGGGDAGAVTIATIAEEAGTFNTLGAAVTEAGLLDMFVDPASGPFTLFAPTDEAFAALPEGALEAIVGDRDALTALLQAHVVDGVVPSSEIADLTGVTTLSGDLLPIEVDGDAVTVGGANVSQVDLTAENGIIHVVDSVIIPEGFVIPANTLNALLDLEPITFEVGSAVITAEGQAVLDGAVEYLLANPVATEIAGHTDSDGGEDSNQALSEARAESVRDYLVENGVDGSLLTTIGYGESQPIADNETAEGKAENRRIEFNIKG